MQRFHTINSQGIIESATPDHSLDTLIPTLSPVVVDSSTSPDEEWIAETIRFTKDSLDLVSFVVRSKSGDTIWTVEEGIFEDRPIEGYAFPYAFGWSQDGEFLFFTHRGGGDGCFIPLDYSGQGLLKLELDSGDVIEILDKTASWMALSPGEETLAYVESWDQVVLRNLVTGNDTVVNNLFNSDVVTIPEDTLLEEAARIMVDSEVGGLPVMRGDTLVGIITESDLFKVLLELLGGRRSGIRLTVSATGSKGTLAKIANAIFEIGGNIVGLGVSEFKDAGPNQWEIMLKVQDVHKEPLVQVIQPVVNEIIDVRGT